eukprot:TRINITY_DN12432_c0_g2_i11.p1 TRINITY_DN12432_c0_g2~~TRINITY_DN12432_c0_g2_i11.p1  ORF type:complete len:360 (-),score=51.64 TRINITY_DN12432_c0_g2_i11:98-1177(-)
MKLSMSMLRSGTKTILELVKHSKIDISRSALLLICSIFLFNDRAKVFPTTLLIPFRPSHCFDSTLQALHFVSSIPRESKETLEGRRIEQWSTFHSFLTHAKGDTEPRSVLLCCLLLGFGLEAYIAVGTRKEEFRVWHGPHTWVLTCLKNNDRTLKTIYFWETMTGERMEINSSKVRRYYGAISCVFGAGKFYGNVQREELAEKVSFDFEDGKCWKSMSEQRLKALKPWNFPIALMLGKDPLVLAQVIEEKLKERIKEYRKGKNTEFDEELSSMLNYNLEMLESNSVLPRKFEPVLNLDMKNICTVDGNSPDKAIDEIMITSRHLLNAQRDPLTVAVQVKATAYPENVFSFCIILALKSP